MRRELAIVLRARMTWIQAALSALLAGHSFALAIDLFSAASRSAEASLLLRKELDPLLGIVRPMMGGIYLSLSLLAPIAAARPIAIEKERKAWKTLLLSSARPLRVTLSKVIAGASGVSLQLLAPLILLGAWRLAGGHLAFAETAVAISGYVFYALWVNAIASAAAAWTETLAQAATVALVVISASWAIDASEGFAALAWLGRALDWSVTTHLQPMDRGTIALGAYLWMGAMTLGALALTYLGARSDLRPPIRIGLVVALAATTLFAASALGARGARYDVTEGARGSFSPSVVEGLRALDAPPSISIALDRDDARRRQLEIEVLEKLRLARPDFAIEFSSDARTAPAEVERDAGYGKITIKSGTVARETYAIGEVVPRIFEVHAAAGGGIKREPPETRPRVLKARARAGTKSAHGCGTIADVRGWESTSRGPRSVGAWRTRSDRIQTLEGCSHRAGEPSSSSPRRSSSSTSGRSSSP
jgi:ABC-2 type transport system permease protein